MIEAIVKIFETCFQIASNVLTMDLASYSPQVNNVMQTINGTLQAIGYAMLIILTLWNFVKTSSSIAEIKRPETVARVFVRFIITKYVIGYAWTFVTTVFSMFASLTSSIFSASGYGSSATWNITPPASTSSWLTDMLDSLTRIINPLSQIPSLLISLICFIIAIVLGVTLVLTVIGRFFKVYLFAALAPLPLSCFGADSTQEIGRNFIKSFIAVSVEGLVIGMAMIVFSAYLQMGNIFGTITWFDWLGDSAADIVYSFSLIFDMMLFLGIIKGTDHVIQRVFGV